MNIDERCEEPQQNEKKKTSDSLSVLLEQQKLAKEAGNYKIRKFWKENVYVTTITGEKIWYQMWVSDHKPKGITEREESKYMCDVCQKEFDKRQKLLLHKRFHKEKLDVYD